MKRLLPGLVLACLGVGPATAQTLSATAKGSFTLSFEVRWGQADLRPGNYTFTLERSSPGSFLRLSRGDRQVAVLLVQSCDHVSPIPHSELVAVRTGGTYRIRFVSLGALGLVLRYSPPRADRRLMTASPDLVRRVPISMARSQGA